MHWDKKVVALIIQSGAIKRLQEEEEDFYTFLSTNFST